MKLGIDLGSSTAKLIVLNNRNELRYKTYRRHNGKVKETLENILSELPENLRQEQFTITMTGSAGMGLASRINIPFSQEVIALTKASRVLYPETSTFIELGGEDAKIVLFAEGQAPEMKMNGNCAGGTGSFIEQMANLLNVDLQTLNELAKSATNKLYIASRCGVFAKTDVQSLLNKGENKNDIAKSVFIAVANQTITTLLAGAEVKSKILFAGGPLSFLSELRKSFVESLELPESAFLLPDNSEVLVAIGAALLSEEKGRKISYDEFLTELKNEKKGVLTIRTLEPLFKDKEEYKEFKERHSKFNIKFLNEDEIKNVKEMYLGIDAGSTTTKLILLDENNNIIDKFYSNNHGSPQNIAVTALNKFRRHFKEHKLKAAYATGYGEEFVRVALNLDGGIVETMAHFTAGSLFNDKLSFIVDVGGQDIKSIKIENGIVTDIQLNEACSSGTGSFIQTFASNLNLTLDQFVEEAIFAEHPVDLGTRCSVFMNSKVKEALKDGVAIKDIAAGLAYSVIKNALYKVIKIKNIDELGDNIFVQGGTFKNDAILRAFEQLTGKNVVRLNISEYMGAFGAALYAKEFVQNHPGFESKFDINIIDHLDFSRRLLHCKCCGNNCEITLFKFKNGNKFYSGNRCEKYFSNKTVENRIDENFFRDKEEILFNVDKYIPKENLPEIDDEKPVIGIPRVLSVYEHYPFFYSFFRKLGFKVVLSDNTSKKMYYKGLRTVAADNLCLPAKVANGHIFDLIDKKVDRIFYPSIVFEEKIGNDAKNTYNCPIVTGYGEILKRNIKTDIPIDSFAMSFNYMSGVKRNAYEYLKEYGITKSQAGEAIKFGMEVEYKSIQMRKNLAKDLIEKAKKEDKPLIILLGRPYHLDPMINTGIMDLIYDLGAYAISEDSIPDLNKMNLEGVLPLTQWSYHNRLYLAAKWIINQGYNKIAALQLNSFGCGPDAVVVDEVKTIVESGGKIFISIKIDEMSNLGAAKIRIRSLLEALNQNKTFNIKPRIYTKEFTKSDKRKTILVPYFAKMYSELLEPVFYHLGYNFKTLYNQSIEAVDEGLKYVNNDMCYPAIVVIGDLIKALKSGKYSPDETVVALSQTNGQCRASNYVPLLKKALIDAGFFNTPVISLSFDSFKQGFTFNPIKFLKYTVILFTITDGIVRMKLRTKPYEKNKGETIELVNKLLEQLRSEVYYKPPTKKYLRKFMKSAVARFNKIPVEYKPEKKKIGIVGEIYLKSNCFSNNYLVEWLEQRGYEVVLPSYTKYFEYGFYSRIYSAKEKITEPDKTKLTTGAINHLTIEHYRKLVEEELKSFKRYKNEVLIGEAIRHEDEPLPQYLQFGEGWLLPLEISEMVKDGVRNVISLQPFGCISNHIVAKGVYRKLKDEYNTNLLLLDYEPGTSEVNTTNRLELFLSNN